MRIYIDKEFRCHTTNPDGIFREFDVPFADGKCVIFVEGYRYVPENEIYTRDDGVVFNGEMIAPFKSYEELDAVQRDYEREKLADAENALAILLGGEST